MENEGDFWEQFEEAANDPKTIENVIPVNKMVKEGLNEKTTEEFNIHR